MAALDSTSRCTIHFMPGFDLTMSELMRDCMLPVQVSRDQSSQMSSRLNHSNGLLVMKGSTEPIKFSPDTGFKAYLADRQVKVDQER